MNVASGDLVLLTGLSGFIAKHVACDLLKEGYRVRGTVRSREKGEAARRVLELAGAATDRLEVVEADLTRDAGWDEALAGCRFVQHTASPFPASQPRDKFGLVPVARGGTLRVVEAAKRAGVERLVLTSSVASVCYGHEGRRDRPFDESDFSVVESPNISPYAVSKTVAEQAAWNAVAGHAMELAVVNPSLVLGPLLDRDAGTSAMLVAMMMNGRLPALPDVHFGFVDVRDVATAHVAAMRTPQATGRRFIVNSETRSLRDIVPVIAAHHPEYRRRLPRYRLPFFAVRAAALVSAQARSLAGEGSAPKRLDNSAAQSVLGLRFRSFEEAVRTMASSLIAFELVRPPR